jgi:AcrR family transcriptional regulator
MIASELKMSSGNLNYHFKKREDILQALYFEMVETFDKRVNQLGDTEITLRTAKEDITESLKRMVDYRFFWTDLYNLLRLNKEIKEHYEDAYEKRFKGFIFLFQYLNEKGVMRDFEFKKESLLLAERIIGFSNTWLYNSFVYDIKIDDEYIERQTNNLLMMLYPYLTDLGKDQFKRLVPELFI